MTTTMMMMITTTMIMITTIHLSKTDLHRLEGLIRRAKHRGFIPEDGPSFKNLALQMDSFKLSSGIQITSCAIYVVNGLRYPTLCALGPTHSSSPPETLRTFSSNSYIMTSTNTFF